MEVVEQQYKDTKIGKIPVEWGITKLAELLKGKPVYGANASAVNYVPEFTYRYVRITDISEQGNLIQDGKKGILKDDGKEYLLKQGDLLIARTGNTVGKSYLYNEKDGVCSYAGYLIRFRIDESKFNTRLLFHILHSDYYYRWVKNESRIGAQPNINAKIYQSLKLPLPPLPEQKKIAAIISTVDEQIATTTAIIQQSQQLKKGLMQQLFSKGIGHTTFKKTKIGEIPESWEVKPFNELMVLQRGHDLPVQSRIKGSVPIIGSNGIVGYHNVAKYNGYGIMTGRSGTLGKVYYLEGKYHPLNTSLFVKEMYDNHPKYLYYFLIHFKLKRFGTGTGVPTLNRNVVHKIKVAIPNIEEQKKIATILTEVDDKIQAELQQKERLEELKKGLMQVLLTGQVRVKI